MALITFEDLPSTNTPLNANNLNNNFNELKGKNTYSTSTESGYNCIYSNEHFGGTILFDGNSASTITLSDDITNYSYIEVYGYATAQQNTGSKVYTKVWSPSLNNTFYLSGMDIDSGAKLIYIKAAQLKFNTTTSISFNFNYQWYKFSENSGGGGQIGNFMRVTRVIGYK